MPAVFTVNWMGGGPNATNWADLAIENPGNVTTSLVVGLSYAGVILAVRKASSQVRVQPLLASVELLSSRQQRLGPSGG